MLLDRDSSEAATIVWAVRMPRTLLLVGLALGAAGALMQAHTRNPLYSRGARWTRGR